MVAVVAAFAGHAATQCCAQPDKGEDWFICSYNVGIFWISSTSEVVLTERLWLSRMVGSGWLKRTLEAPGPVDGLLVKQGGQRM